MQTDFGALSDGRKTAYLAQVWTEFYADFLFSTNGMLSKDVNDGSNVVHNVDGLTDPDGKGLRAIMPFVPNLVSDGTVGANVLKGREEGMEAEWLDIKVDQLRHAVRRASAIKEQATVIRFRVQARRTLGIWLAQVNNEIGILTLTGQGYGTKLNGASRSPSSQLAQLSYAGDVSAPTSARKFFCGDATSTATLTGAETIQWNRIVEVAAYATTEMIGPLRRGGARGRFCLLLHTNAFRDLKKDPNYKEAVQLAGNRGDNNQMFTGAAAVIDNVAIYDTPYMPTTYGLASGSKWGASGTVDGSIAMLVGAQALAWANIGAPSWVEDNQEDYQDKPAISIKQMFGWRKPKWKHPAAGQTTDQDYGTIAVYSAAAMLQ